MLGPHHIQLLLGLRQVCELPDNIASYFHDAPSIVRCVSSLELCGLGIASRLISLLAANVEHFSLTTPVLTHGECKQPLTFASITDSFC